LLPLECYFLTVNCVAANSPWQQKTTNYADSTDGQIRVIGEQHARA
jgi:hypothetical protein